MRSRLALVELVAASVLALLRQQVGPARSIPLMLPEAAALVSIYSISMAGLGLAAVVPMVGAHRALELTLMAALVRALGQTQQLLAVAVAPVQ